ncbi:MAG TPA: hypothetical protein VEC38_01480 [Candidatus Binataceae bacterium]|nr:hypothetical protein [Candidatus Binataceae bacterium]
MKKKILMFLATMVLISGLAALQGCCVGPGWDGGWHNHHYHYYMTR